MSATEGGGKPERRGAKGAADAPPGREADTAETWRGPEEASLASQAVRAPARLAAGGDPAGPEEPAEEVGGGTPGDQPSVGGALVAASAICPREVWLIAHAMQPDEDNPHLVYGRFLHQRAYARQRRDVQLGGNRLDLLQGPRDGELVVLEVKKTDRAADSARLQLAHYLLTLEEAGVRARGELRFPDLKRAEEVTLDDELRSTVRRARAQVLRIATEAVPPPPRRVRWCAHCAYAEFCWA